jgi:AcrR family transcriptional regulator
MDESAAHPLSLGLRARKKERTRLLIAETARGLFRERGFDRVTVAEIADAAEVSEGTVFNYFRTKEDLFYSGMDVFERQLVDAVAARPAGESVLAAFRRFVLDGTTRLSDPSVAELILEGTSMVRASAALQSHEHEIVAQHVTRLAALIAGETRASAGDPTPLTAASALMGAQRALVAFVHARVVAGERGPQLAEAARREGRRAFALLEGGLASYAIRAD